MLDESLLTLARTRIELDLRDRHEFHMREFAQLKATFSVRGALTSGFAQAALDQAIGREYEIRSLMVWQVLSRVLSGERLAALVGLGSQLKTVVSDYLQTACQDLERDHAFVLGLMSGLGNMRSIDIWRDRAYERVASEIDLSLLSASRAEAAGSSVVNIYQPFGIIQTGSGSTAAFNQLYGPSEREKLSAALDSAHEALKASHELAKADVDSVVEVIKDAKIEVALEKPNLARLRGSLMAIATTVQALGSAAPAYQLLKAAAALVGVTLP